MIGLTAGAVRFFHDCRVICLLHLSLLIGTFVLGGANQGDLRVQAVVFLFVLAGWWIAPLWVGEFTSPLKRYAAAAITSFAIHGSLAFLWTSPLLIGWTGARLSGLVGVWVVVFVCAGISRWRRIRRGPEGAWSRSIPIGHVLPVVVIAIVCVSLYRVPRSNDIHQFMLQQQDMLENDSALASSIGMSAMEVDETMPRWRANLWHLWPCLVASTSGVAVDQVLLRYATAPLAFVVLVSLSVIVRDLVGGRTRIEFILLAVLGPAILWYRSYSAFNYSFRLTNNLLLDKDFALFFLVPAVLWLSVKWAGGKERYVIPLLALLPAIIRFHPLTSVYLVLLVVPIAIWKSPLTRRGLQRSFILAISAGLVFVAVYAIGDAQGNHDQIRDLLEMDLQQAERGRPTHYWSGFYNSVPDSPMESNTTRWTDGRIHLKHRVITRCGMLVALHIATFLLLIQTFFLDRVGGVRVSTKRIALAGFVVLTMLWGLWLVSGTFLTLAPHFTAGYERLHWFAFPIAICVVAAAMCSVIGNGKLRRVGLIAAACFVVISAVLLQFGIASPLRRVRGLNSLPDYELDVTLARRDRASDVPPLKSLSDRKPGYLADDDRVLLLDFRTTQYYWLIRQGVFWSDPYAEAFAWSRRGDAFLRDREVFYALLDRQSLNDEAFLDDVRQWISEKGITLIVDYGEDASAYLEPLLQSLPTSIEQSGVWRIKKP